MNITTLDIDKRLNPDVVDSVLNLPFANNSFEVVACCELLEHLPYENFPKALSEICRVSSSYAIISLPDLSKICRVNIYISSLGNLKILIPLLPLKLPKWEFNGEHYWNIGTKGYPLRKVISEICNAGFKIVKNYRVFEIAWHRFFVLRKPK